MGSGRVRRRDRLGEPTRVGPGDLGVNPAADAGTGFRAELTDVKTHFRTRRGLVRAVDGVSLTLERGKSLGIVGESGSGKTILSRSIMGLLPTKGT